MSRFHFHKTEIEGLLVIEPIVHLDSRGYFMEVYNCNDLTKAGINVKFVQDNQSKSYKGVLRGLHFQKKHPQAKIVRVIRGEVFDVAVDLRERSLTYGKWHGIMLNEHNQKQLYVPEGFAHGFLVMSNEAEVLYKCSDYYYPDDQGGIIWNDTDIAIEWGIGPHMEVLLSEKDKILPRLRDIKNNIM